MNLIDLSFSARYYNKTHYKTSLLGSSDCNSFVPFYSLFAHNLVVLNRGKEEKQILEYCLPIDNYSRGYLRQYTQLLQALTSSQYPVIYKFKLAGEQHTINLHRGLIYKGEDVYVCLGIDSEYVLNTPLEEIQDNPDMSKFTLFIDNSFESNPQLKNIKKKVGSMYITPLREAEIDIVLTSRLKEWLFKNNYEVPKFKTVVELIKHLKEEAPKMLLTI